MAEERVQRRLAAILSSDVVGYSRLMGADEAGTLARLKSLRADVLDPKIAAFGGRIVKTTGDGTLVEFPSAVDAVSHAIEVQAEMAQRNAAEPESRRIVLRIGINVGDIIIDGDDIYGDGVNVAARVEPLAAPGGICITEIVRQSVAGKLDAAFEDMGPQALKNIDAPIRTYRVRLEGPAPLPNPERAALPLPDKPSIAVLPFQNMSGDPDQEYFADGISEDIITALSRFHWFFVIARNSSFAYKGAATDVRRVARELGVQYVLEGSVRRSGNQVRVTAQLIDATNGRHVWAERYDRKLEDIFAVQDEVCEAITTTVAPVFISAEAQRAERKAPESLDAWDHAMRGNWHLARWGKEGIAEARRSFETALEIDPRSTAALGGLALALLWVNVFVWEDDLEAVRMKAYNAARRAVDLDDNDAWAHAILGFVRFGFGQLDGTIADCRRALELNSSLALAESMLSIAHSWRGDYDEAVRHARMAQRLSPRDPGQSMWSFAQTGAEFGAGHYEKAVEFARITADAMPEFPGGWSYLAASLGLLDRLDEARAAIHQLLRLSPHYNLRRVQAVLPSVRPERLKRFVDGLRKAGLPE